MRKVVNRKIGKDNDNNNNNNTDEKFALLPQKVVVILRH